MYYSVKDFLYNNFEEKQSNTNDVKKTIDLKKNISINEKKDDINLNIKENENLVSKLISKENNQNNNYDNNMFVKERESKLMRILYSDINSFLYPFVVDVLNELDFIGSPIYSVSGIDKETLHQLIDRVILLSERALDEIGEIKNEISPAYIQRWNRNGLLKSVVESLLLNDIFSIRRPIYYKNYAPDILK